MVSELHLEISELLEAGVDLTDIDQAYDCACEKGLELAATCMNDYPREYRRIIESWFLEDLITMEIECA